MSLRPEALFLNGVYETVLEEILSVQELLPEQIMFLQPYTSSAIKKLQEHPPSVGDPMLLVMSTTGNLTSVQYAAEIVGWEDKTQLPRDKWRLLNRLVVMLQPNEEGLYDASKDPEKQSINLLFIRRLRRVESFDVAQLIKTKDGTPVGHRSTSGGWSYVRADTLRELIPTPSRESAAVA